MKFVVLQEINRRWYWELRLSDGEAIARSPMGFSTNEQACSAIRRLRSAVPMALVFDLTGNLIQGI